MKTIKYIVLGMVIMATYPCSEITSRMESGDPFYQMAEINRQDPGSAIFAYCNPDNADQVWKYIHSNSFMNMLPDDLLFAWGATPVEEGLPLYLLRQPGGQGAGPDGADVDQVEVVSVPGNG
ncbi:MAG: hypothetical protein ACWGNV_11230, partial [Bacteroidales bacterium]